MFVWLRFMLCNRRISLYWVIYRPPIMNLRKAHDYIMGALMTGFHSTGIAVSISPDSRFPRAGIMITLQFSYILMGSSSPILPVMMR